MIFLSDIYSNRDVLSLRTGGAIGYAYTPIINPKNLKIEGWYATVRGDKTPMVLPVSELRDMISKGLVVDDHDAITPIEDMVRMTEIINSQFELIGKAVFTDNNRKIGKVQDYAVENKSMFVKKLYVNQSIFKSLASLTKPQLIIDRSQIVDVTKDKIVVKEASEKIRSTGAATAQA